MGKRGLSEDQRTMAELCALKKKPVPLDENTTLLQMQIQQERHELLFKELESKLENLLDQQRHELIKVFKSKLVAKDQLLAKKDEERKAAEDMISTIQEEFTCVICMNLFINAYTLPCAHSFCEWCIKEWMKRKAQCPVCQENITSDPVRSLLVDNTVSKLVDKLSADQQMDRKGIEVERKSSLEGLNPIAITDSDSDDPAVDYGGINFFPYIHNVGP